MLLVDRVERQALADYQAAATLIAGGAKGVDMPDLFTARATFDAQLEAPLVWSTPSTDRDVLLEALRLRRAG